MIKCKSIENVLHEIIVEIERILNDKFSLSNNLIKAFLSHPIKEINNKKFENSIFENEINSTNKRNPLLKKNKSNSLKSKL